jgi:hypothetical protein
MAENSRNIIRAIKSARVRRTGHVARMEEKIKCVWGFGWEI